MQSWSITGMLNSVSSGADTYEYAYDPIGNRVSRIYNGTETRYVVGPGSVVLAETDSQGNITGYYVYGLGLVSKVTSAGDDYYYHYDALGSTVAMTNSTGGGVNKYAYGIFGQIIDEQEQVENPFKFVGAFGVMDEGNGLYYMRARYYDPEIGRFASKDPIGLAGGINMYAYVGGNPINYIDPSGLFGTKKCSYNQQACQTNGGFYECQIAERACNSFSKQNNTYNCIRQCLQEKHKERQPEGQCSEKGQTGLSDFFSEHEACFVGCFKNPENPYNPDGPDLPDKDIRLY